MMKTTTIINEGRLVGYIKLREDILQDLKRDVVIVLEQEINRGDATIITFRLVKHRINAPSR